MTRIVRNPILQVFVILLMSVVLSGCLMSRRIVNITDHPAKNITLLETADNHYYLFFTTLTHQFWQCKTVGESLECSEKLCGGASDLVCPQFDTSTGSNL